VRKEPPLRPPLLFPENFDTVHR
jgi:hypothetical protein